MRILVLSFTILNNVPLAAGYVVAAARADTIVGKGRVDLWDLNSEEYKDEPERRAHLSKKIVDWQPDIIAFSSYVWNLPICIDVSRIVKEIEPRIITIFGGPGATFTARYLLENHQSIDYVVRGEGERAFVQLVQRLMLGERPIDVLGISWRNNSEIVESRNTPGIDPLDSVPSPYLSGVLKPKDDILIETHRGCIFKCGYCQEARGYGGVRNFSVSRVEQEVEYAESFSVRRISFVNSIYNINPQRVEELSEMLARHDRGIQYSVDTYAMLLNERIADLYKKAHIYGTDIGLQSTNRPTLINMKRPWIDPQKFREKHQLLIDRGIRTNIHLILGLPGDTFNTFKDTYDFVENIEPTNISVFRLLVLPGTPYGQDAERFGLRHEPTPPFRILASSTFPENEIKQAELYAEARYKEFLMKNAYRTQKIITPHALHA